MMMKMFPQLFELPSWGFFEKAVRTQKTQISSFCKACFCAQNSPQLDFSFKTAAIALAGGVGSQKTAEGCLWAEIVALVRLPRIVRFSSTTVRTHKSRKFVFLVLKKAFSNV